METLIAYFPREIHFLIAAVSTKNPYLSFFLGFINFIATRRPQDESYKGAGVVESLEGNVLRGRGTLFRKELKEKDTVSIINPQTLLVVNKIVDDETIEVENTKNLNFQGKKLQFEVLPKLDQSKVFDNSWRLLKEGKVVGIFPEVDFIQVGRLS